MKDWAPYPAAVLAAKVEAAKRRVEREIERLSPEQQRRSLADQMSVLACLAALAGDEKGAAAWVREAAKHGATALPAFRPRPVHA